MHSPQSSTPLRAKRRILAAALMGTAVEFYDFFIYGTAAALVFGPLFFPAQSAAAQTLLAFASFGLAFFARPIGAIAFGHFGDRIGRKSTLVASLLTMGLSTFAIAMLPTYAVAGWLAPALLCLMRFGQGFGLGGEWGGAALLTAEHAPPGWEGRFVSIMQLGSPIGFFAANGVFLLLGLSLDESQFMAWGWRIPFIGSAVLVGLGLWMRLKIEETPQFRDAVRHHEPVRLPFVEIVSRHRSQLAAGAAGVVATFAVFYLATSFALALAVDALGIPRETMLILQLVANCFYVAGILIAGRLADRIGSRLVLAGGAAATVALGFVFEAGLRSGSLLLAGITLSLAMLILGFNNGPLGSWLAGLFPVRSRYTGVSLAFNLGGILGGAVVPFLAQLMVVRGASHTTGVLLLIAGLATLGGTLFGRAKFSPHLEQGQTA
ncbi:MULTISPECIES: MFS transporter [unclassified Novosphingobium]|uniref:MFS transporter n=1 Tax=unclassified Novosphingobium TaxID=2644732 RepID=UPI0013591F77|nr:MULTISPECIES: MFS transporter [unclassified Novosphingobium]